MTHYRSRGAIALVAALAALAFVLVPIAWIVLISITPPNANLVSESGIDSRLTFEHYHRLTEDGTFFLYFLNSLVVAIGTVSVSLAIGAPAAYVLSRSRANRFRNFALAYSLFVRLVPPAVFVMPYFIAFRFLGLADTWAGLIIAYANLNIPLVMWSLWSFFNEVPRELDEAAEIDGAGPLGTFVSIILPATAPGLTATAVLTFIMAWNEFLLALILTAREGRTLPVAIVGFLAYEGADWGLVSSGTVLVMLPILLFTFLIQKYMVKGLIGGAVRG